MEEGLGPWAGVDGLIAFREGSHATGTLFLGGVKRLKEDFEAKFFILIGHLR